MRRLVLLLALVLCVSACSPSSPATPSTSESQAHPTATATPTAPATAACTAGEDQSIFRTGLTSAGSTAAQDPSLPYLVVGDGTALRTLTACDAAPAGSVALAGPVAQAPVLAKLASGEVSAFVASAAGMVYRVRIDPNSGALSVAWSRSVARDACPQDRVSAAPAVASGVVYVGTEYGCGAEQSNRIVALSALDGAPRWSFNQGAAFPVGAVRATPVVDALHNRLLVGTTGTGSSLYAIDMINGSRLWSVTAGSLDTPPVLVPDEIITADAAGTVRAWASEGVPSAPLWTVKLQGTVDALVDYGPVDVVESVVLAGGAGVVTPITYEGVARPPIALEGAQVTTAPVAVPGERVFYVGGSDGGVWQLDVFGTTQTRRPFINGGSVCCALFVPHEPSVVFGSTSGGLAKFAVPWQPMGPTAG